VTVLDTLHRTLGDGDTVTLSTDGMWELVFGAPGAVDDAHRTYWVGVGAIGYCPGRRSAFPPAGAGGARAREGQCWRLGDFNDEPFDTFLVLHALSTRERPTSPRRGRTPSSTRGLPVSGGQPRPTLGLGVAGTQRIFAAYTIPSATSTLYARSPLRAYRLCSEAS
jgi:hypothetical protein